MNNGVYRRNRMKIQNLDLALKYLMEGYNYIDYKSINCRTEELLAIESPSEQDIKDANTIITISNILYNNSDISILPLDDGIYDLLIVWLSRFSNNYQVGAPVTPTFTDTNQQQASQTRVSPFIKLTSKKNMANNDMIFREDILKDREITYDMERKSVFVRNIDPLKRQNAVTPHNYPKLVGTLDKCKFVLNDQAITKGVFDDPNVQVFERDFIHKLLGEEVITPDREFYMVLELKYDGISVEAEVSDHVITALSRGDTNNNIATDYTPVLRGYRFPKAIGHIDPNESFGMKFEAMLGNSDLIALGKARNKSYKNPRNAVAGLFGASDANMYTDYITLIPLATSLEVDRLTELEFMNKYYDNGEILRYAVIKGDYKSILFQVKRFVDEAEYLRPIMPFTYDGVVCSFIEPDIIAKLGRVNSINKYQMAIKFNAQSTNTIFFGYTFSVGQNGTITPVAHYKPVELFGNTHNKTTMHSYARFMELSLKEDDIVTIELINDVIPYISKPDIYQNEINENPIISFPTHCPACGTELVLSKSGKTCLCPNKQCEGRKLGIIVNMFSKIGFKDFSEESIKAIGCIHSLSDLMNITEDQVSILGSGEANNFIKRLDEFKETSIYDYRIIGALGFSDIAQAKWKLILNKITIEHLLAMYMADVDDLRNRLLSIKGIGPNAVDTIIAEMEVFYNDIYTISKMDNVIRSYGISSGLKVRFTGFRDPQLCAILQDMGYDCTDGGNVTKDTDILVIRDKDYVSSAISKVGPTTLIVTRDKFVEKLPSIII